MAERLAYLEAVIGADITQFRKAMRDVRNDVGVLSETIGGLGKLGRTATFAISAPLATLGSFAVQAASEFDASMRNINSIAMMGEKQFDSLSASVLKFGATTRGGAVEAANALYTVFSAGITGTAEAMQIMEIATQTAEAGLADMETTTESLVASILGFGQANMTAMRASDNLTQMVQIGVGSMQQFAGATAKVIPVANTLGIEIEDLFASLAFLTQRGNNAAVASTQVRAALTALMKPTEGMEAAFRSLGVRGAEDLIQKMGGLQGAFQSLVDTTDGTSASISDLFSNVRGKAFVDAITGNPEVFKQAIKDFSDGVEGATGRAHQEQMKSFSAQWDLMTSAVEGASIAVGQQLLPAILPMIHGVTDLFNAIANLNPELLSMGVEFAKIAIVIPPIIWLLSSLLNPIGLVIAGIGGLGVAFVSEFKTIEGAISGLFASTSATATIWDQFKTIFGDPPPVEEFLPDEPMMIPANEIVTVEAGDTIWDMWWASDKGFTQQEFYDEWVRLNGDMKMPIGKIIKIPTHDLTPEIVAKTTIDWDAVTAGVSGEINMNDLMQGSDQFSTEWTPEEELQFGINRMLERLPEMFAEVTEAIRLWADDNVSIGLDAIAGLFIGEFNTDVMSDNIAGIFDFDFSEHFPKISESLAKLVDNIGVWLLDVGIPLLSKGVGRFIGEFGALIGKGFGVLGDFISGGGIADSTDALGDSVVEPFLEGFQEAADANGFDTGIDSLLTAIAGAIGAYAVLNFGIFGVVATGITSAISLAMSATTIAAGFGKGLLLKMGAALFASASGSFLGVGVTLLAAAVSAEISSAVTGAFVFWKGTALVQGLTLWAGGIITAASTALATAWATATAAGGALIAAFGLGVPIVIGIAVGLAVDFFLPEGVKETIRDWIGNTIAPLFGAADWSSVMRSFEDGIYAMLGREDLMSNATPLEISMNNFDVMFTEMNWDSVVAGSAQGFFEGFDEAVQQMFIDQAKVSQWTVDELEIAIISWKLEDEGKSISDIAEYLTTIGIIGDDVVVPIGMVLDLLEAPTIKPEDIIPTTMDKLDEFDLYEVGSGTAMVQKVRTEAEEEAANNPTVIRIFDETKQNEYIAEVANGMTTTLATTMAEGFASGDITAESFNTDFLVPFKENWINTFGDESDIRTSILGLSTNFTTAMTTLATTSLDASIEVGTNSGAISTHITSMATTIDEQMTKAKGAVASLLKEIKALASISTNLKIDVKVTGEINAPVTDGSARTGMDRVPFDGYIAELHKDERVLTRSESEMWANGSIPSTTTGLGGGGNVTNNNATQNTVLIDGSVGVDELLEELERRGIYLT